ncbi:UNVERIFIED_CONTAM: mannose-6-phosphate isomerase, partial [Bacteroidetes bacterium 56_B9]
GLKRGKTEMWYIMNSEENASLYCGLKKRITPDEYKTMVNDGSITEVLREYKVKEGDVFFLPPGRIHSIGSGCFLAE